MAAIIQKGALSAPLDGGIFEDYSFWLSRRVPSRTHYVKTIQANGGTIADTERHAGICLVDHLKSAKETGEKLYSYQFIDECLKKLAFADLEEFRVRPKKTTSAAVASKGKSRNFFSREDDDVLLQTISEPGVKCNGNLVYKRLAEEHPQHTMHSWRSRWVDHFSKIMPHGPVWSGPRPEPNSNSDARPQSKLATPRDDDGDSEDDPDFHRFDKEEQQLLLDKAADILCASDPSIIFRKIAREHPDHTIRQWENYFYKKTVPAINARNIHMSDELNQSSVVKETPRGRNLHPEDPGESSTANPKVFSSPNVKKEKFSSSPVVKQKPTEKLREETPARRKLRSPIHLNPLVTTSSEKNGERQSAIERNGASGSTVAGHPPSTQKGSSGNQLFTRSLTLLEPARWRVEVNPPAAKGAAVAKNSLISSSPRTPQNESVRQKRKRDDEPAVHRDGPKRQRRKYASISEIPSTPEPPPKATRGPSPELGTPVVSAKPAGVTGDTPTSVPDTPATGTRTLSGAIDGPTEPHTKQRISYQAIGTQAIYAGEVDQELFDAEMNFELPLSDDEATRSPAPKAAEKSIPSSSSIAPTTTATADTALSKSPVVAGVGSSTVSKPRDDPDGVREMKRYLAYCEKKFDLPPDKVIFAVERTGGIKRLMEVALEAMANKKPLPEGVPGIWTEEEDSILMGSDSRVMKKLSEKKGAEQMSKRMEFLNLWNMA